MEEIKAKASPLNTRICGFVGRAKLQGYEPRHYSALLLNPWRRVVKKRTNELLKVIGKDQFFDMIKEHRFDGEYVDSYERECFTLVHLSSLKIKGVVFNDHFHQKLRNIGTQWHFALKNGWQVKGSPIGQMWKCGFNRPGHTNARNCSRTSCPFCHLFLSVFPLYSAIWDAVMKQEYGTLQVFSLALPPVVTAHACEMIDTRGISTENLNFLNKKFDDQLDTVKGAIRSVLSTMSRKHETVSYSWYLEPEVIVCDRPAETWHQPPMLHKILEDRLAQRGKVITDAAMKRMLSLWRRQGVIRLRLWGLQILQEGVHDSWAQLLIHRLLRRFEDKIDLRTMLKTRGINTSASAEELEKTITPFVRVNTSWLDGVEFYSQIRQLNARNKGGNCYRANFPLPSFEEFLSWRRQNR
jgi:hypothetical protein